MNPPIYLQQRALAEMGFYQGPQDGIDGPATRAALEAWLASRRPKADAPGQTFETMVAAWKLRHFSAAELLTKGASNGRLQLNTDPPRDLWNNIRDAALAADEARHRLGSGLVIASAYRSPAYNHAVGGASNSYHLRFQALDLRPADGDVARLHRTLRDLRAEGFAGARGIGRYATFCHIDNGPARDW